MSFSDEVVQRVWEKGRIVSNYDKDKYRKDQCGAWITRAQYGNRDSMYGWEIDHIDPDGGAIFQICVPYNGRTMLPLVRDG